jgi:hypothetical protein
MAKISLSAKVREYIKQNPTKKVTEIAKELEVKYQYVYMVKRAMDKKVAKMVAPTAKKRKPKPTFRTMVDMTQHADGSITEKVTHTPNWETVHIITSDEPLPVTMHDPVNHPAHYKYGGIETIDFIEAKELGYNLGNVVKYVTRADHKGNRKQDLEKAIWYLQRELSHTL